MVLLFKFVSTPIIDAFHLYSCTAAQLHASITCTKGIFKGDPQNTGICSIGHICSLLQSNGDPYRAVEWFEGPFSGKIEKNVRELYWSPDIHLTNQKPPHCPSLFSLSSHALSLSPLSTLNRTLHRK